MMIQRLTLAGRAAQHQRRGMAGDGGAALQDADTRGSKAALVIVTYQCAGSILTILTYNMDQT